jgi:hypothetical protein
MVTLSAHEESHGTQVENQPHQHAFVLVGREQLFGVHMTQYHCELHKYQIILKLSLPDKIHQHYLALRDRHPRDTFVLCNARTCPDSPPKPARSFSIPDLGSGLVKTFSANIFQGIRPLSPAEIEADEHFFPWAKKYAKAALGEFEAVVERIVMFRPFDHLETLPNYARYFIFGDSASGETHMTNLQTAQLITDAFTPPVFGPDYDHAMSLQAQPDWLQQASMLEAGVVVTTPQMRLLDPQSGLPTIPQRQPFDEGSEIEVLYRGIGPVRRVTAGPTFSYCTAVCNSPRLFAPRPPQDSYLDSLPTVPEVLDFSQMPKRYWAFAEDDCPE